MSDRPLRRSLEAGHSRKFLVIVDHTPEGACSLYYALKLALRSEGAVSLLAVIEPEEPQAWVGVNEKIREEAFDSSEKALSEAKSFLRSIAPQISIQTSIREGARAASILKFIQDDADISLLVLAAAADTKGPGPLVSTLVGQFAGHFPIPIIIVPGDLDPAEIDAMV